MDFFFFRRSFSVLQIAAIAVVFGAILSIQSGIAAKKRAPSG